MDWYSVVKGYYDDGYYTKDNVKVFVEKGKITETEYEQITGEAYVA
jgi:uncharacterized XkdX family phage protein